MSATNQVNKPYVEVLGGRSVSQFIGNKGDLFYDPGTTTLRISDGSTPGGSILSGVGEVNWGSLPGKTSGSVTRIALGNEAGQLFHGDYSVAIGSHAGYNSQYVHSVAVGRNAGETSQGTGSVAIGYNAAQIRQLGNSVAIGTDAGQTDQKASSVAIGHLAGGDTQGTLSVSVGGGAGNLQQGNYAVAVGRGAGSNNQSEYGIAIGSTAGQYTQGIDAIAIGRDAGNGSQGQSAIAIGANAGFGNQPANTIILNATGSALNQATANTFTVAPIRSDTTNVTTLMYYNTSTKEVTYGEMNVVVTGVATGDQSLVNAASASRLRWTEIVDTVNAFTDNIFTAPYDGYYQVNLSLYFGSSVIQTSGFVSAMNITPLNTRATMLAGAFGAGVIQNSSRLLKLLAGDTIAFYCNQTSGGDRTVDSSGTTFSIYRVAGIK